jgi:phosphoribosylanthranilate isomerase
MNPIQPIIKVCGMREPDNIRAVEALGIDMMGFIFWPKSSRYVSQRPDYLPKHVKRVGVFVDEDPEQVRRLAADYALDFIQLHGHESPDYIRTLKTPSSINPLTSSIIKAFSIASADDLAMTKDYEGLVDYFLFDTKGPSVGGNGEKFDWNVLSAYDGSTPFLLSGGISPDDAEVLTSHHSPLTSKKCIGIDLNSRFELSPGLKDITALRKFLNELNR